MNIREPTLWQDQFLPPYLVTHPHSGYHLQTRRAQVRNLMGLLARPGQRIEGVVYGLEDIESELRGKIAEIRADLSMLNRNIFYTKLTISITAIAVGFIFLQKWGGYYD